MVYEVDNGEKCISQKHQPRGCLGKESETKIYDVTMFELDKALS